MKIQLFFILCAFLLLSGCRSDTNVGTTALFEGSAMTVPYKIIVGDQLTRKEILSLQQLISNTFDDVNHVYNKWNPQSELSRLNRLPAGKTVTISPALQRILEISKQIVELSEGRFDPTIEPLQNVWKKSLEQGMTPDKNEIDKVLPAIGWNKIHFGNGKFSKDNALTSLDLGAIAKGLCVDLLIERLNAAGYPDVFVEWGGEIRASGHHPDNRSWNIFISRLGDASPEHAIAHLSLEGQAIATSGDYLQNWTVQTAKGPIIYSHIIDPRTDTPLTITHSSMASASVLAPTCAFADGLATAAMIFPTAEEAQIWAKKIQEQNPGLLFWFVSRQDLMKLQESQ